MSLDQFSTLLVLGCIGLFFGLGIVLIVSALSSEIRSRLAAISYAQYLGAIAAIATLSVAGTLVFQLAYETPVCELCWWQRIFLYPIAIITPVAIWYRSRSTHVSVAILSVLGFCIAAYHYYFHFQRFVLGNELSLPCTYGGLLPACTDSPILIFGFATIPFLGLMMFGSLIMLCWMAESISNHVDTK